MKQQYFKALHDDDRAIYSSRYDTEPSLIRELFQQAQELTRDSYDDYPSTAFFLRDSGYRAIGGTRIC
jgi:hypothetical protein